MVEDKYKRWEAFLKNVPREQWDEAIENLEWFVRFARKVAERKEQDKKPEV